ncbi:YecA family protein [Fictibacillus iocasae]|uniref:YecA family protein n=1 Tax=Fictibacillus iocasae TaxID=2715437 RepID=A0ABW2NPR6_9BACL
MMIGRNEPCHCGSGKKYKKCCAGKDPAIATATAVKETGFGRFISLKMQLRMKLDLFLDRVHPRIPFNSIRKAFFKEMKAPLPADMKDTVFQYYLHFYHRFDNHKRAVEWLLDEEGTKLDVNEHSLLKQWCELVPRLLECVEHVDKGVMVQDKLTGEMFLMGRDPNMHYIHPWSVTFGMIEEFEGAYYLNGIMLWTAPGAAVVMYDELSNIHTDCLYEHYPRLLSLFLKEADKPPIPVVPHQEDIYELTYTVTNWDAVKSRFRQSSKWSLVDGEYVLLSDEIIYRDSLLKSSVEMNEILAKAVIKGNQLVFHSPILKEADTFKKKMEKLGLKLVNEKVIKQKHNVTIKYTGLDFVFYFNEIVPDYAMLFAQKKLLQETENEIFALGAALKDLPPAKAVLYLKQIEHLSSKDMKRLHPEEDVTEDFNTVRKELNLPLSPFVTGGAKRKTSLLHKGTVKKKKANGDAPFFLEHFSEFFDLKTRGKTKATANKYQHSLELIGMCLLEIGAKSWDDVGLYEWGKIMLFQYFVIENNEPSVHQVTHFLSALMQFVTYQDEKLDYHFSPLLKKLVKEHKHDVLDAVKLRSIINPAPHDYITQAYIQNLKGIEGVFAFEKVLSKSVKLVELSTGSPYNVSLPAPILRENIVHPGMVMEGQIVQTSKTVHKFSFANRIFPPGALPFLAGE